MLLLLGLLHAITLRLGCGSRTAALLHSLILLDWTYTHTCGNVRPVVRLGLRSPLLWDLVLPVTL